MTNQSHTELAAQARELVLLSNKFGTRQFAGEIVECLRRCAAALESPERVQGGLAMLPREPNDEMCDQGAQALVSWENGSVWPESWGEIAARQYRKDARKAWVAMAETFLCATPSPQAEKQPLSETEIEVMWGEFMSAKGSGYVPDFVRAIEAAHGIVTKESST